MQATIGLFVIILLIGLNNYCAEHNRDSWGTAATLIIEEVYSFYRIIVTVSVLKQY